MWEEVIQRIKLDREAAIFQAAFNSEEQAKTAMLGLSFAERVTREGMVGVGMPKHITVRMGKSMQGTVWVLLGGRFTREQVAEVQLVFGRLAREVVTVLPDVMVNKVALEQQVQTSRPTAPADLSAAKERLGTARYYFYATHVGIVIIWLAILASGLRNGFDAGDLPSIIPFLGIATIPVVAVTWIYYGYMKRKYGRRN